MGWEYQHREKGISNLDWFQSQLDPSFRLLEGASKQGVFYGACEVTGKDGTSYVTALVSLMKWVPHDYLNFGVKLMEESQGPYVTSCPQRILDLLSPPPQIAEPGSPAFENILLWRAACRHTLHLSQATPPIRKGDRVRFHKPFQFQDGSQEQEFTLQDGRRGCWRGRNGRLYRLPRQWRVHPHQVNPPLSEHPRPAGEPLDELLLASYPSRDLALGRAETLNQASRSHYHYQVREMEGGWGVVQLRFKEEAAR